MKVKRILLVLVLLGLVLSLPSIASGAGVLGGGDDADKVLTVVYDTASQKTFCWFDYETGYILDMGSYYDVYSQEFNTKGINKSTSTVATYVWKQLNPNTDLGKTITELGLVATSTMPYDWNNKTKDIGLTINTGSGSATTTDNTFTISGGTGISTSANGNIITIAYTGGSSGGNGYCVNVQAASQSTLTDGQTLYWGGMLVAPSTTANRWRVYMPKTGTIKAAYIFSYAGTAGSAEGWSMYIRKNNSVDTLIQTLSISANDRVWSNTGLSISVVAGDYIEIREIQPTWVTNPATVTRTGQIYIE